MQLAAKLTVGWECETLSPFLAMGLHQAAIANEDYAGTLAQQLQRADAHTHILALDGLFRKSAVGFKPIRRFVSELANLPVPEGCPQPLICEIDVFAFAFLAGDKNFDLLLPRDNEAAIAFAQVQANYAAVLQSLENFERLGIPPNDAVFDVQQYLEIRQVVERPSARDELRALTILLLSGPSTLSQISTELGLNYTLGQRSLAVFESTGILKRSTEEANTQDIFVIETAAIPLVVFFLRETIGLDLLSNLPHFTR